MNIIIVDDEKNALADFHQTLLSVSLTHQIFCFLDAKQALCHVESHPLDLAFLDINLPEINGIQLAKKIKQIQPAANIIFVTGYSEYALDAFSIHASGYILKPASAEKVAFEMANLRTPPYPLPSRKLSIHTFGNFEVFYNNIPLKFKRNKTKELFAYLVDRKGAGSTTSEICSVLWENKTYTLSLQKQFQTLVSELIRILRQVHAEDILIKRRNFISIDTGKIDCDYYRFLSGDVSVINTYTGEYMSNYSWAEFTSGFLYGIHNRPDPPLRSF